MRVYKFLEKSAKLCKNYIKTIRGGNIMYVDVHCHLNHKMMLEKIDSILSDCEEKEVKRIVCSGVNVSGNRQVLELAEKYDIVECTLGIYPIDALGIAPDEIGLPRQIEPINLESEFKFIKENKSKIVGVGEVGMDFHWDKKFHDLQKHNFSKIIEFVERLKKPIVIHSRKAEKECIEMLESSKIKNVVMHCFGGRKGLVKKCIELGYYFSIPSIIQKSQLHQIIVDLCPLSKLLTETDSPWLSPTPGVMNDPTTVIGTVAKMAEIKNMEKEEIMNQIWKNYMDVFH